MPGADGGGACCGTAAGEAGLAPAPPCASAAVAACMASRCDSVISAGSAFAPRPRPRPPLRPDEFFSPPCDACAGSSGAGAGGAPLLLLPAVAAAWWRCSRRACQLLKTSNSVMLRGTHCTRPMPGPRGVTLSTSACRSALSAAGRPCCGAASPLRLWPPRRRPAKLEPGRPCARTHESRQARSCCMRCSCCRSSPPLSKKRTVRPLDATMSMRLGRVFDGSSRTLGRNPTMVVSSAAHMGTHCMLPWRSALGPGACTSNV